MALTEKSNLVFTNPRLEAVIEDYPLGGNKRGRCTFRVEHNPKKGYRFVKQTFGKPKADTYGGKAAIVDGNDGRTYLIQFAGDFDFIKINRFDFKNAAEPAFPSDPLYATLAALIAQANA